MPPALAGAPVAAAADVVVAAVALVTAERTLAVPTDEPVVAAEPAPQAASKAIEPAPAVPKPTRRSSVRLVYLTTVVTFR